MPDFRHIVKGSAYLAIGSQLGRVISFVQVMVLTKYLGSTGYGVWSLVQAMPGMLIFLSDLGLNSLMLRAIARDKAQEQIALQKVLFLKIFLAPLYVLAVYLVARTFGHDSHVITLTTLYAVCVVANLCGESLIAVWRAHEKFAFEAKITLAKDATLSLLLILVIMLGFGLGGLIVVSLVHSLLISLLLLLWYLKQNPLSLTRSSLRDYAGQLRAATPFAMYDLVNPLFMQIDVVMLGWLSVLSSVGIYNAGYRIILMLYFIPNALQRTLLPRLSLQYCSSRGDYASTLDKALRLVVMFAMPVALGLCLVAEQVVGLVFSAEYKPAAKVLAILALSIPFYFVRVVMNTALFAANREKTALVVYGGATLLNAALDYLLIPRFDYIGAALGSLSAEVALCSSYCLLAAKDYVDGRLLGFVGRVALASVLMAAAVWFTRNWALIIRVPVGAAVYVAALFGLRILELSHIKQYWTDGAKLAEEHS